jgi:uncharacterized protein (TIGR02996 family)
VRVDDLLAAVCATPDDDALRQVYADALIEAGDPLGEWIALDLAKARGAVDLDSEERYDELVRTLDIAVRSHGVSRGGYVTFARGFPRALHVWGNVTSVTNTPGFATLERLDALDEVGDATVLAVLDHPNAANVREVSSLRCSLVERACAEPRGWTTLDIHGESADPLPRPSAYANLPNLESLGVHLEGARPIASDATAIPGLRNLVIYSSSDPRIATLALPASLETLELRLEGGGIGELALPPRLRRLEVAGPLPRLEIAAPIATVDLSNVWSLSRDELAAFAGTRELWLGLDRYDAATFAAHGAVESLRLWNGAIAPDALRKLTKLRALVLYEPLEQRLELAGLPLETLDYAGPLEWIPTSLPLRELTVVYPEAPAEIAALIARFPALERLALDAARAGAASAERWHVAIWLPVLAASAIQRFTLLYSEDHRRGELELVRGDRGELVFAKRDAGAIATAVGVAI